MPQVCEFHEGSEGESTKCQCECCECRKSVSSMRGVRMMMLIYRAMIMMMIIDDDDGTFAG